MTQWIIHVNQVIFLIYSRNQIHSYLIKTITPNFKNNTLSYLGILDKSFKWFPFKKYNLTKEDFKFKHYDKKDYHSSKSSISSVLDVTFLYKGMKKSTIFKL